jgi:hypothetical protein
VWGRGGGQSYSYSVACRLLRQATCPSSSHLPREAPHGPPGGRKGNAPRLVAGWGSVSWRTARRPRWTNAHTHARAMHSPFQRRGGRNTGAVLLRCRGGAAAIYPSAPPGRRSAAQHGSAAARQRCAFCWVQCWVEAGWRRWRGTGTGASPRPLARLKACVVALHRAWWDGPAPVSRRLLQGGPPAHRWRGASWVSGQYRSGMFINQLKFIPFKFGPPVTGSR